jgi:RES domain
MPILYRCVVHTAESPSLFAKHPEGRFHTNEDWQTAWIEVQRHLPTANPAAFDILEFEFDSSLLIDASNPAEAKAHGVSETQLVAPDYAACQELARSLRQSGVVGLLTYSAADRPDGRCIVLFEECLKPKQLPKLVSRRSVRTYLDESIQP